MTADPDELLTVPEVAALTRLPAGTLRSWRHSNRGPASFPLGRRVVYRRSVVVAWIAAQEEAEAERRKP